MDTEAGRLRHQLPPPRNQSAPAHHGLHPVRAAGDRARSGQPARRTGAPRGHDRGGGDEM